MDKKTLSSQIEIVLTKEYNDGNNSTLVWEFKKVNGDWSFVYPHSDTLIDIFSNIQIDDELKKHFVKLLQSRITLENEAFGISKNRLSCAGAIALCFYTLIKLGLSDEAILALNKRQEPSGTLVLFFEDIGGNEYAYFSTNHLNEILRKVSPWDLSYSFADRTIEAFKKSRDNTKTKLIEKTYGLLKEEIKGINVEINRDKKIVSEKIVYLEFDDKYNELLNDIDKYLHAETSSIVNSGMINNLRVFLQDLFKDIAQKISEIEKESIPKLKDHGEMGNIRNYLKNKLNLSDNDNRFINSFVDILHAEGGHAFTSNKEYFRLARNIAIEIALLILSKYEKEFPS